jgi:hypothetical protein
MRASLARISLVNNTQKIKAPLFVVVVELNDPRAGYTGAEQIVAGTCRNGMSMLVSPRQQRGPRICAQGE